MLRSLPGRKGQARWGGPALRCFWGPLWDLGGFFGRCCSGILICQILEETSEGPSSPRLLPGADWGEWRRNWLVLFPRGLRLSCAPCLGGPLGSETGM